MREFLLRKGAVELVEQGWNPVFGRCMWGFCVVTIDILGEVWYNGGIVV